MVKEEDQNNRFVNWVRSRGCLLFGFFWGLAEGTFFFLVPDIIITLVALFSLRQSVKQIISVLAGSLLAGLIMYYLGTIDYELSSALVSKVPFISESMFVSTSSDFKAMGVWALCKGPMSGIPYKIYAVQASQYVSLILFLLVSVPARLERLAITWVLFTAVGYFFRKKVENRYHLLLAFHGIYWVIIYIFYWTNI